MAKRSIVHYILIAAVLVLAWLFCDCGEISGAYDVVIHQVMRCENSGNGDITFTSTRLNKVSRFTYTYFTNYTTKIPIADNLSSVIDLEAWGNGGWRPGFFTLDIPLLCTDSKRLNPLWFYEFIKNTGKEDCPIPPGSYTVSANNFSFAEFSVPMFPYGKYRMLNQVSNQGVLVGCIAAVVEVTPKRKQRRKKTDKHAVEQTKSH